MIVSSRARKRKRSFVLERSLKLPPDIQPGIVIPTGVFRLVWHRVAAPHWTAIRQLRGKLNSGTAGLGTVPHLAGELFSILSGAKLTQIHYKGAGPALADLIGGQVQVIFSGLGVVRQQAAAGNVRILAVGQKTRLSAASRIRSAIRHRNGLLAGSDLRSFDLQGRGIFGPDHSRAENNGYDQGDDDQCAYKHAQEAGTRIIRHDDLLRLAPLTIRKAAIRSQKLRARERPYGAALPRLSSI